MGGPFQHLMEPIKYLNDPKLVALKNKRREELREEFFRKKLSPYSSATHAEGTIFDPALQRFISTHTNIADYWKATPKTVTTGLLIFFGPWFTLAYFMKKEKDQDELERRTGQIAYRDRYDKFP